MSAFLDRVKPEEWNEACRRASKRKNPRIKKVKGRNLWECKTIYGSGVISGVASTPQKAYKWWLRNYKAKTENKK